MKENRTRKSILAAMFLAFGLVLPFLTGQMKEIGDTLLPMHIPTMFCGLVCGPWYGLVVGFAIPVVRSIIFSMPMFFPNSIWMAFELATYGCVIGVIYRFFAKKNVRAVYLSLIPAMISGRIVWGIAKTVLLGIAGKPFSFQMFLAGGILDAIPGIILQLILIPAIMSILNRYKR